MKKIKLAFVISVFLVVFSGCISNTNKEEATQQTIQVKQDEGIRLDSLAKLNIHVTLWAEDKESFEQLNNVKLELVSSRVELFKVKLESEFSWEGYKRWMNWEETNMSIFTYFRKDQDKFVCIGDYFIDGQILIFRGNMYKYTPN